MARISLSENIWYDPAGSGYFMLDITDKITPLETRTIDGKDLFPKNEYHISLVPGKKIVNDDETLEKLAEITKTYLSNTKSNVKFESLTEDYFMCRKDDELTVIGGAVVSGMDGLRALVREIVPTYEIPFLHVTLLKSENSEFGIGINSDEELRNLCKRIEL